MKLFTTCTCALVLLLSACSETPRKPAEEKKAAAPAAPAEPVTGRYALSQMYLSARGQLGADTQVLQLSSINLTDIKPAPGKSGAWQATFVSPSAGRAKSFTYSVIEPQGNLHKGVFAGPEQGWTGPRGVTKPYIMAAIKFDSDQAYETALRKGADYARKNPNMPMAYMLEHNTKFPDPSWRVIWGESAGTSNFSIYVDAMTGLYQETAR